MAKKEKKAGFAQVNRFNQAEYERVIWDYLVPEEHEFEMLLNPYYWSHVATKGVRPWNRIEVRDEQGRFFAVLLVIQVGRNFVQVAVIYHVEIENVVPVEALEGSRYQVKHVSMGKWRILREDGSVLRDGFDGKEPAEAYLRDHLKALAA